MQIRQPEKRCSKCHHWLPYSAFSRGSNNRDGLQTQCKACDIKRSHEYNTPERNRSKWLRRKYGITASQYKDMFACQGGVCAVCKLPEKRVDWRTGIVKPLAVDHDHKTDDVRALLCETCNVSLGFMDEDPDRILALHNYAKWCQSREPNSKIIQLSIMEIGE